MDMFMLRLSLGLKFPVRCGLVLWFLFSTLRDQGWGSPKAYTTFEGSRVTYRQAGQPQRR